MAPISPLDEKTRLTRATRPAEDATRLHPFYRGKMQTLPKCPVRGFEDFAVWYTPGVAAPCRAIQADPDQVYAHTNKANTIAIVSPGRAAYPVEPSRELLTLRRSLEAELEASEVRRTSSRARSGFAVATAVLSALSRLAPDSQTRRQFVTQLPGVVKARVLAMPPHPLVMDREALIQHVAAALDAHAPEAERALRAVYAVVRAAVSQGELEDFEAKIPADVAVLLRSVA